MAEDIKNYVLSLSSEERQNKKISEDSMQRIIRLLDSHGLIIIEDALDVDFCDKMNDRIRLDSDLLLNKGKQLQVNFEDGNIQQELPPDGPTVKELVLNPYAMQIATKILGQGHCCSLFSGNLNLPNSKIQPIHSDTAPMWAVQSNPHPPSRLIVNYTFIDVTESNGSMEVFPTTHRIINFKYDEEVRIDPQDLRDLPPGVRANMKKGSLLIRDDRLWHRGMTNPSPTPRFMAALIYTIRWQKAETIQLQSDAKEVLVHSDSDLDWHNIEFKDRVNYLNVVDFDE
jgi:ectoine hydroxylase-related dioxygenase (phytanoyl-CoA dioxygenase family)